MATDELARLQAECDALRDRVRELEGSHEAFLHAVSHDLRAPLRHVTSYADVLREVLQELPDAPPQVREALGFADTMRQSARRMAAMLDGLQAISRAGRAPLHLQPLDVAGVVRQARSRHGADAAQWRIDGAVAPVLADSALFERLITELLANALKFSSHRDPPRIDVALESAPGQRVRVRISDNGIGFDPERAHGLFGVFQRLHRDDEFEGVGTGLALCHLIAERHGAHIAITARPDDGCTVTLDWPGV